MRDAVAAFSLLQMLSTDPPATPSRAPASPSAPWSNRTSSSLHSLRVIGWGRAGSLGVFTGALFFPLSLACDLELELRSSSFRRSAFSRFLRLARSNSLRSLTMARTSTLLRASSRNARKSWPSSFIQCLLSAVRSTKTKPSSSRTGASTVAANHPGASATASISVSQLAPPVPHELSGWEAQPCGGGFHAPAGSSVAAQCRTRSASERAKAMSCRRPPAVRRASTTSSFTAALSPMFTSRRQHICAPPARASHSAAICMGDADAEVAGAAGAGVGVGVGAGGVYTAAGAGGDGEARSCADTGPASMGENVSRRVTAVWRVMPGGSPNSRSSTSRSTPWMRRSVTWSTAAL
mmetsp:Transcript_11271/g.27499  ORF Transcript_11271/g.27499 Transcript_11271/m.27499 type:complete len:351 (+) Transcript_11271:4463-5515(+)